MIRQRIPGSALGWTPSIDRCLERGGRYAWSVRALGPKAASDWSAPSLFEVAAAPSAAELEAALSVVRSYLETGGGERSPSGPPAETGPESTEESEEPGSPPAPETTAEPQLTVDGGVAATFFTGDGSMVTSLDPAKLSGAVPVTGGGTGATDAGTALTNLGAAAAAHVHAACSPGDAVVCYTGPAATRDVPECASGMRFCQADGTYGAACEGEVLPVAEECDGLDNDCNQAVDDGAALNLCPPTANVVSTICTAGACAIEQCVLGFEDTNGVYTDGCEDDNQRTVFVTSTTYTGNIGGLAGADTECDNRALAGGLVGTYKAWLSTSLTDNPANLFEKSTEPYLRTDGVLIANDWTDLTDGSLQNPIDRDESGQQVAAFAWTGTKKDGTPDPDLDCGDWGSSSSTLTGRVGSTFGTMHDWTDAGSPRDCDNSHRLYCFEQE